MPLLSLNGAQLSFGPRTMLSSIEMHIEPGDRLALVGRNGEGKSTLLKVILGEQALDDGVVWHDGNTRISYLSQELPSKSDMSVAAYVAEGVGDAFELLQSFNTMAVDPDVDLDALAKIQEQLDTINGWSVENQLQQILSRLSLNGDASMASLSGGWRRRAALARALVLEPDVLLLDEPTNHLDIPAIEWLEQTLSGLPMAIVFVTHDRQFLKALANRIAELDRGNLSLWPGNYDAFIKHRDELLNAEEKANELFDKRLAEEEKWIRQGIKARRTRNEGRVRALKAMREEHRDRVKRTGTASFSVEQASAGGKHVAELEGACLSYDGKQIIAPLDLLIRRGERIGIAGANGAGKTTLLKMLLGELAPSGGTIKLGTNLKIAYFDQTREALEPEKTLLDNICGGREFIEINGRNKHGISYMADFLFSAERVRTPVKALSGGEQNRAILAKIFSQPANLLVLDEPTNDLDVETLELLEEILLEFKGTVLLVSHDRVFMDNVITRLLVVKPDGSVDDHVGGFSDWLSGGNSLQGATLVPQGSPKQAADTVPELVTHTTPKKAKLSYKEQKELNQLPEQIEGLEAELAIQQSLTLTSDFYQKPHEESLVILNKINDLQAEIDAKVERWSELESE